MFIAQAFKYKHEWWLYLVGFIIIFTASQLGSIPFIGAVAFKLIAEGGKLTDLEDPTILMTVLDSNLTLFLMLLSYAIGLWAVYLVVKYLHKQPFLKVTTFRKKMDWGRFFFGFGLIATTTIAFTGLDYYNNPENYVLQFNMVPFLILLVIAVIMVPLQTSFEEYLFRGYLMQGLGVSSTNKRFPFIFVYVILATIGYTIYVMKFSPGGWINYVVLFALVGILFTLLQTGFVEKISNSSFYRGMSYIIRRNSTPLLVTSFVFGALHFFNPEVEKLGNIIMIYYIGTGLFLGVITLMDEGMELALGFHAGNNLIAALLVTADWTVFQTNSILKDISEPSAGVDVLGPVLILYPIFIAIMALVYRWSGWADKLFGKIVAPIVTEIDNMGENA